MAVVFADTFVVGTAKETVVSPARIVCAAGMSTAEELLVKFTEAPPEGAWPFSTAMICGWVPPLMLLGATMIDFKDGGITVN